MKRLSLLLALVGSALAEPLPPYSLSLDRDKISSVPLHKEVDTLLIFPDEVESISGKGLTSGTGSMGMVLYKQGEKNKKTILLRHLDNQSAVLLTVMLGENAFVFRLEPSAKPASVIYLHKETQAPKLARKITPEEALVRGRPISEERKLELLRLTRDAHFLKERIPKLYSNYTESHLFHSRIYSNFSTAISLTALFETEDAFVFLGTIRNRSSKPVDMADYAAFLKVGKKRSFPCSKLRVERRIIAPGATVKYEGLLLGDGKGSPLHLSLENSFGLHLKPALQ